MLNVYEKDNRFYLEENNGYRQVDMQVRRTTIVLQPTDIVVSELDNAKVYTYKELRDKILRGE